MFNMMASVNITGLSVKAAPTLETLGLCINSKLKWGPHLRKKKEEMKSETLELTVFAKST